MYRQNVFLNDFVNFLKARGRFRDIEFLENKVKATPVLPDHPVLVFYQDEDKNKKSLRFILEIKGNESEFLNMEIREFFRLNKLPLVAVRHVLRVTDSHSKLSLTITGLGELHDSISSDIFNLLSARQLKIVKKEKHLIFMEKIKEERVVKKPEPKIKASDNETEVRPSFKEETVVTSAPIVSPPKKPVISEKKVKPFIQEKVVPKIQPEQSTTPTSLFKEFAGPKMSREVTTSSPIIAETDEPEETTDRSNLEKDLFKSPIAKERPYLKQSSGLFRKDNWEEDLPTEFEMEILELTYKRIKHRTKPEILAKQLNISIEEAEEHLRSLIKKGLLRSQVGWFIIKKSHLPFFRETFADSDKKAKKKKSVRISRVGEGLTKEEIATIRAIKERPNLKAQSNLLTKPTGLKQSILKEVLRNLVDKGILRVSYGWYILKDKHILEQKRGKVQTTVKQQPTTVEVPSNLELTPDEKKIVSALLKRPNYKAQSNILVKSVKMNRDRIRQVLRDLVEKGVCRVEYGWYSLQNPEKFATE